MAKASLKGDPATARAMNRRLILNFIRQHGPKSRAELAIATGLSAAAVVEMGTADDNAWRDARPVHRQELAAMAFPFFLESPSSSIGKERAMMRRSEQYRRCWYTVFDQGNVDREILVADNELFGSVERINDKNWTIAWPGRANVLLAQDRNIGVNPFASFAQ